MGSADAPKSGYMNRHRDRNECVPVAERDAAKNEHDSEETKIVNRQNSNENEAEDKMEAALQSLSAKREHEVAPQLLE